MAQQKDSGFVITLDEKPIRTPQQKLLQTSSQKLAQQIAAEWQAQDKFIDTDTMPLTRLLNVALDRIAIDREALLKDIAGYGETDLLCYRFTQDAVCPAEAGIHLEEYKQMVSGFCRNNDLGKLQAQHFDPILGWLKSEYDLRFVLTDGLMPVPQPQQSLQKLVMLFAASDDHELAALSLMVPILGSSLLTLAVWKDFITADEALVAARLDEAAQQAQWGEAPEAAQKWQSKCRDVKAAAFFLAECMNSH